MTRPCLESISLMIKFSPLNFSQGSGVFDTAALDGVKARSGLKSICANAGKVSAHYVGSAGMKPNIAEHESEGQDT